LVKSEIIKQLHQKYPELNRSQIEAIVNIFFDTILDNLAKDRPVELRDFGRFSVKKNKRKI
jgi:nucleoid DNA-binding protein